MQCNCRARVCALNEFRFLCVQCRLLVILTTVLYNVYHLRWTPPCGDKVSKFENCFVQLFLLLLNIYILCCVFLQQQQYKMCGQYTFEPVYVRASIRSSQYTFEPVHTVYIYERTVLYKCVLIHCVFTCMETLDQTILFAREEK